MSEEFPVLLVCKNGHRWKSAEIDAPCLQCKIDELLKFRDDSAKASAALCAERIADRDRYKQTLAHTVIERDFLTAENKALAAQLSKVASDNVDLREENKRLGDEAERNAKMAVHHAAERVHLAAALRAMMADQGEYAVQRGRVSEDVWSQASAALAGTAEPDPCPDPGVCNAVGCVRPDACQSSAGERPSSVESVGRPDWLLPSKPEDWPDDPSQYMCHCATCGKGFHGDKRRVVCRVCSPKGDADQPTVAPQDPK